MKVTAVVARAQRLPVVRDVVAVQRRYGEDGAGYLASTVAYHAFFSLFPLLLVAMSVVGFVLDDAASRDRFTDEVARAVPGLRPLIGDSLDALVAARGATGLFGLLGLIWTGTGVVRAAGHGMTRIFRVDLRTDTLIKQNAWAIGSLLALGAMGAASTALSFGGSLLPGEGIAGAVLWVAMMLAGLALDVGLFMLAYRILTRRPGPPWRALLPGSVLAAVGWTVLKLAGSWYARNTVAGAQAVHGTFAGALGVLVMLSLGARIFMYGAVLNAVRMRGKEPAAGDAHAQDQGHRRRVA